MRWYRDIAAQTPEPEIAERFLDTLGDDLNLPQAIAEMHKMANTGRYGELLGSLRLLGFSGDPSKMGRRVHLSGTAAAVSGATGDLTVGKPSIDALIAARAAARKAKDYKEADRIRAELDALGIALKDSKDPATGELVTTWEVKR